MPSTRRVESLDNIDRDIPTTAHDSNVLWRLRDLNQMDPQTYLDFLVLLTKNELPSREIAAHDEPFEL